VKSTLHEYCILNGSNLSTQSSLTVIQTAHMFKD